MPGHKSSLYYLTSVILSCTAYFLINYVLSLFRLDHSLLKVKSVKIPFIIYKLLIPVITLDSFFTSKMKNISAYTTNSHTYTMANPLMPCSRYIIFTPLIRWETIALLTCLQYSTSIHRYTAILHN